MPRGRNSRTWRTALNLGLALLAGAAATWAIAWACAVWVVARPVRDASPAPWPPSVPPSWPAPSDTYTYEAVGLRRWLWLARDDYGHPYILEVVSSGIPFRSMRGDHFGGHVTLVLRSRVLDVPDFFRPGDYCVGVPCGVLPLGFALDTLLIGGLIFGLVKAPSSWRRRQRLKMGLCAWCGYNRSGVAETAPCPECGREP